MMGEVAVLLANNLVLSVNAPACVLPTQGTLQGGYLRGFKELVRSHGRDPYRLLEEHEIDPVAFETPDYNVECVSAINLLEHCSRLIDPVFGLRLAERQEPEVFGSAVALARAAPNLRQALQSLVDYVPVSASPECEMEVVSGREIAELRWRTQIGLGDSAQANFQGLLLMTKTLRMLLGQDFRPSYATLALKLDRSCQQLLMETVGCRVRGEAEAFAVAFPARLLDHPIASSNRALHALLQDYLTQLSAASRSSFVEQVGAYVRGALRSGNCSLEDCADKLGTSARTLQKRLTRANATFSDVVQDERNKLAKHALLWSDCTLDEIASQLGYAEQTCFGRAFKRYSGMTPQAFRQQHAAPVRSRR
jgi:AraC-like DNA-binding protein